MNIAGVQIGPNHPTRVIAEVSNSHNGDKDRALRLLDEIKAAGADIVKFQAYTPAELVKLRGDGPAPEPWGSDGWTMRKLYTKAQTPRAWFPALVKRCEELRLPWFASVFGESSLRMLERLGCPAYKIAALDRDAVELVEAVHATGKPVLKSDPCAPNTIILMDGIAGVLWCPPGYPQTWPQESAPAYAHPVRGLSYHGTDWTVPLLDARRGAQVVECHVHLADEPSELEANVCITTTGLANLCRELAA